VGVKRKRKSKKTEKLKEKRKRRKNFFPTLIAIFISWGLAAFIVYFIEPETLGAIPVFFLIIFFALLFIFSTIFANTRRGVITATGLVIFLILRYFGVGNILNFLLIFGITVSIEYYFTKT